MASTKVDFAGMWAGQVVACIASGPSLTEDDCMAVRGLPSIVTNTTFRMCPWASVLLAHDVKWWQTYAREVDEVFGGLRVSCAPTVVGGAQPMAHKLFMRGFGNSGAAAVTLAILGGASKVLMLGYDCKASGGKTHWHGSHPGHLGDAKSIDKWPAKFAALAAYANRKGVEVVNLSRDTALTCFRKSMLEDEL